MSPIHQPTLRRIAADQIADYLATEGAPLPPIKTAPGVPVNVADVLPLAKRILEAVAITIEPARAIAAPLGYELAMYGYLKDSIDLVAIPWQTEAAPPERLVAAINEHISSAMGRVQILSAAEQMPHGRQLWRVELANRVMLNLSVMPPTAFDTE